MNTGAKIVMLMIGYMMTVFIVFSYMPSSAFQVSGGSFGDYDSDFNATASYDDVQNVGIFDFIKGMLTFGITGAAVPWWLSLYGAVLPLIALGIGIYAMIRGGT